MRNVQLTRAVLWHEHSNLHLGCETSGNVGSYSIFTHGSSGVDAAAISLDQYVEEQRVPRVDVVKIDVEGAELFALRGMRSLIQAHHPVLLMEVNDATAKCAGHTLQDLWSELVDGFGYRAFAIRDSAASSGALSSFDGI